MKKVLMAVACVVLILLGLEFDSTRVILEKLKSAFYPVFIALLTAMFLNAPVSLLEKTVFSSERLRPVRRALSLGLTITLIAGVATGLVFLVAPDVKAGLVSLKNTLASFDPSAYGETAEFLIKKGAEFLKKAAPEAGLLAEKAGREIVSLLLGLALGVMAIASKESVAKLFKKILVRFNGEKRAEFMLKAVGAAVSKFSAFMAGQALEALIFGAASYVAFLVFGIPYPLILALISAITNLIPTLGGYIGGGVGAILTLAVSPDKVLLFIVIVLVLQTLEQFTTYPIVVGRYVGLKGVYVFLAVIVGGGLFGFWGLVLGVPVAAFIYNLWAVISERGEGAENPLKGLPEERHERYGEK